MQYILLHSLCLFIYSFISLYGLDIGDHLFAQKIDFDIIEHHLVTNMLTVLHCEATLTVFALNWKW